MATSDSISSEHAAIRRALTSDVPRIIEFIRQHWRQTHYFVNHPDFFLYHYASQDDRLCFYIAETPGHSITGILGYLDYASGEMEHDVILSLWKVKNTSDPSLGIKMLETLKRELRPRVLACTGINEKTIPIYKFLRYTTGKMTSYVYPNRNIDRYKILSGALPSAPPLIHADVNVWLRKIDPKELAERYKTLASTARPYKSVDFIRHRFSRHPVFKYEFWCAEIETASIIFVIRRIESQGSAIVRIADIFGDHALLARLSRAFQKLLDETQAEYLELVQCGVADATLKAGGFVPVDEHADLVMPIYFQPFERRNIDIFYFASHSEGLRLFLGDGDQDRPN